MAAATATYAVRADGRGMARALLGRCNAAVAHGIEGDENGNAKRSTRRRTHSDSARAGHARTGAILRSHSLRHRLSAGEAPHARRARGSDRDVPTPRLVADAAKHAARRGRG